MTDTAEDARWGIAEDMLRYVVTEAIKTCLDAGRADWREAIDQGDMDIETTDGLITVSIGPDVIGVWQIGVGPPVRVD